MLQSLCKSSRFRIQAGKFIESGSLETVAPDGFVKSIVSFFFFPLIFQRKSQIIVRLIIVRVRIGTNSLLHRLPKILFRPCKITLFKQTSSIGIVQADIGRIPTQPLQIIILGMISGMPVLFHMQTVEEQILRSFTVFRKWCCLRRFRHIRFDLFREMVRDQFSAICGTNTYPQTTEYLCVILLSLCKCRYLLQFFTVDLHFISFLR